MAITNGLITLNDAKKSLGWSTTTSSDDDSDLERYIEAATPVIENIVGPILPASKTFTFSGGRKTISLPTPFETVASVTVDGAAHTGYVASPRAGIIYADAVGGSFTDGIENVTVTVTVGSATIPPNVLLATRELVRHLWQVGRQGTRPAYGTAEADGMVPTSFAVPKRVLELLQPNARVGGFA
ncbi:hypothetical protein [Herbiconiux sp. VKM Ac-2851]|uniref:hypothetical protein n=1 Tax=Herbiconiux sp. VKM Ac-2851 TaxID=2739025 RepID=UPI001563072E|nr:hypothetical protein [Herbiconiux sp. VKM Ac-2851]NQX36254.1 hypothetical protein [Herbiconiux sp. VKM Ac-2851]